MTPPHSDDSLGVIAVTARRRTRCIFGHACDGKSAEEGWLMHMATKLKPWTLDEVHRLPDDGNKYELVRGELFVTPPPNDDHETILARLSRILDAYVHANDLGFVYHPRSVVRVEGSEVEPDLMVRRPSPGVKDAWERAPRPILIVEVLSPTTRRRDQNQKKEFYLAIGIDEYWMVDPERRCLTVVRPGRTEMTVTDVVEWSPAGVAQPLAVRLTDIFG
jgi:Uma2 family endonuclease